MYEYQAPFEANINDCLVRVTAMSKHSSIKYDGEREPEQPDVTQVRPRVIYERWIHHEAHSQFTTAEGKLRRISRPPRGTLEVSLGLELCAGGQ